MALKTGVAIVILSLAGCGSSKQAVTTTSTSTSSTTVTTVAPTTITTATPRDLHKVDWKNITITKEACGTPTDVDLVNGGATLPGARDNLRVADVSAGAPVYGNIGGDVGNVVALEVLCQNDGGTADGQLGDSMLIYSGQTGQVTRIGLFMPQHRGDLNNHVPLFGDVTFALNKITVKENVYGPNDSTCCPSIQDQTVWTYANGTFAPA